MADVVHRLRGSTESERRALFCQVVAQSFDLYVAAYGHEPDALAYVLGGITQPTRIGWEMHGQSRDGATSFMSLAAVHMLAEAGADRVEIPVG